MKNKGFVLMETLVMSAVIVVLLSVCYYPFSSIVNNNKTYQSYDNVEDIYKLNNVRLFIYKYMGVNNILKADNDAIRPIGKQLEVTTDEEVEEKYNQLLNTLNIENIYLVNYNLSSTDYSGKFSYDLESYFKYINNATVVNSEGDEVQNTYRLVAKFVKDDGTTTYSNIKIWEEG